jgi:hypothetical protein
MANVNTTADIVSPVGGAMNDGTRLVYLGTTAKAAQNDTVTLQNVTTVLHANLVIVATGAAETYTVSNNVITLTSATTGSVRGVLVVR